MDFGNFGDFGIMGSPIFSIVEDMLDFPEDHQQQPGSRPRSHNPSRAYVRDAKAMAATPADVIEYQDAYMFIVDMPGISPAEIKVQVENENVLVVSGERRRHEKGKDKDESSMDGVKYVKMERRVGKFMRKFVLPENANVEAISAVCQDGVLKVTVEKVKPPQPKTKTIEVKVG